MQRNICGLCSSIRPAPRRRVKYFSSLFQWVRQYAREYRRCVDRNGSGARGPVISALAPHGPGAVLSYFDRPSRSVWRSARAAPTPFPDCEGGVRHGRWREPDRDKRVPDFFFALLAAASSSAPDRLWMKRVSDSRRHFCSCVPGPLGHIRGHQASLLPKTPCGCSSPRCGDRG